MKRDLLDILACPLCHQTLELKVEDSKNDEIVTGQLKCSACHVDYPIEDAIPNLLPPDLRTPTSQ